MNDTGMSPQGQTGLAAPEQAELQALEQVVSSGLAKFIEVGNALARIREARLYRASHATFEEYCRERWHLDKRYANRIIQASEVAANLGPIGPVPTNEAQVRPLASLPPAQQREVWTEATATAPGGKLTAQHVQATVDRIAPKDPPVLPTDEAVDVELSPPPPPPRIKSPNVLDGCAPEGTKVKGSAAGYGRALEAVLDELGEIENGLTYYGIRALIAEWPKSKTVLYHDGLKTLQGYITKWIKEMEKVI